MAASDWIAMSIHPTHPKILALAHMTGDSPAEACGKAVAWFWHCDQNYAIPQTYLRINAFHNVVLSPRKRRNKQSYFEAMSSPEIDWVELDDGNCVVIKDYENNFSKSSKRRAQTRKRVSEHRAKHGMAPPIRVGVDTTLDRAQELATMGSAGEIVTGSETAAQAGYTCDAIEGRSDAVRLRWST